MQGGHKSRDLGPASAFEGRAPEGGIRTRVMILPTRLGDLGVEVEKEVVETPSIGLEPIVLPLNHISIDGGMRRIRTSACDDACSQDRSFRPGSAIIPWCGVGNCTRDSHN